MLAPWKEVGWVAGFTSPSSCSLGWLTGWASSLCGHPGRPAIDWALAGDVHERPGWYEGVLGSTCNRPFPLSFLDSLPFIRGRNQRSRPPGSGGVGPEPRSRLDEEGSCLSVICCLWSQHVFHLSVHSTSCKETARREGISWWIWGSRWRGAEWTGRKVLWESS